MSKRGKLTPAKPHPQASIIDAEATAKILQADMVNIVRKVKAGKPLTAQERAMLKDQAEEARRATGQTVRDLPKWAHSKVEAAALLELPHRTKLSVWRNQFPDAPTARSNGREPLWEWRDFIDRHGLRGTFRGPYHDSTTAKMDAEVRQAEAKATLLEQRVEINRKTFISREQVNRLFSLCLLDLKNHLLQMGDALALKLKFLRDEQKIADILNESIRAAFRESAKNPISVFQCPNCKKTIQA